MKILIIDDEKPIREVLSASLKDESYDVDVAQNGDEGLKKLAEFQPQICFLDIWMPGRDGIDILTEARQKFTQTEFIMISGHGTIETAVKSTKLGAYDFIEKPLSIDKIIITLNNLKNYLQEKDEKIALLNKLRKSLAIMGDAESLKQTKQLISRLAPTQSWCLLTGENGSGKCLVAQNIHYFSTRASQPFLEFNCASVAEELLEGELFGIEKNAFPGVDKARKGKLELCQGGTLYLEEIQELPVFVQMKLLKFMQEKKFTRYGGSEEISADVRVIASSTQDLNHLVKHGRFREDFYHRLNILPFHIASLREKISDIPTLVSFFSDSFARESGEAKKVFSEKAIEMMKQYSWPGNIRELKNFVERVYILTPSEYIDVHDIKFAGLEEANQAGNSITDSSMSNFRDARAQFEKDYLIQKIKENGGNISKTAEVIGLERSYLHRKIKSYGIEVV
ncbi:MAG: sigma-54 dependent transcriptional regulator [Bdellovibrionaceae bacterium]|nr:sigma-54 dependent transcriptional regulator [Pseudobdellovibrionaceae bacterium]NUM60031.1 sigma-54-dependent Fis family transcriptional regulator [Pseudobdellovibrionaceae bacterium]